MHKVEGREREEEQQTTGGLRGLSAPKLPMPPGGCMHNIFVPTSARAFARLPFAQRTRPHCNRVVRSQKNKWHLVHPSGNFSQTKCHAGVVQLFVCVAPPCGLHAPYGRAPSSWWREGGVARQLVAKENVLLLQPKQNSGLLAPVYFQGLKLTEGTARRTITVVQPRHPTL